MREKLLEDIRRACEELALFLEEKVPSDLEQDRGLQLIVEREFEIIGEAMNRLQRADEAAFAKITHGHRIIGTRNILAHGYDIIDHRILWDAFHQDLPKLLEDLKSL
ncbi:HepT-like ribonuclease domain-containing protein [Puniceicoccus vermicola]|uniref:DUF86 domain-containing protein n=1 Tax=Puniceicoccus vermicola TaxID=388746 RepID=A0A7X1E544_9BACT|nr:DUF86 domain-containing protein [Puniceicoccus vermicola]MBC2601237.1 DUF86 domain-containing protein [Puniceicoccus vermicola]